MKKIVSIAVIVTVCAITQAQYSTYYNVDVNKKVDVNQNVNVSGIVYEHQTITTIDYGALQLANAQNEANKLERIKYSDEQKRLISLEIASNPLKAYDYGYQNTFTIRGKDTKGSGFKSYTASHRIPHNALFVGTGNGRFENTSSTGITTEVIFYSPLYNKKKVDVNVEKDAKMEDVTVGQLNAVGPEGEDIFVHKKEINRATVLGVRGFKSTLIWEDDYQYVITDNFHSYDASEGNGVRYFAKVRTYGSKNEVTFEELEGRRYYLRQLVEKTISTAKAYNMKY
jgi:hypothetical protein